MSSFMWDFGDLVTSAFRGNNSSLVLSRASGSVPSLGEVPIFNGLGDFYRVPPAVLSLYYARSWNYSLTLEGKTWAGVIKRGQLDEDGSVSGTELTAVKDLFNFSKYGGAFYQGPSAFDIIARASYSDDDGSFSMSIGALGPINYYATDNKWTAGCLQFSASTDDGSVISSSLIPGVSTGAYTYCGETVYAAIGDSGTSFSATIEPASWLT